MTSEEINALPENVKRYIHDLETNADPAGIIRENIFLKDQVKALEKMVSDDKRKEKVKIYCAALTGILANPKYAYDGDTSNAERIADYFKYKRI